MIDAINIEQSVRVTSNVSRNHENLYKALWHICLLGIVAVAGWWLWKNGPDPALLAWIVYLTGVVAILLRPRYGIYLVVFFALAGDLDLMYWYPFEKNFSSAESIFYVNDKIIISPLESYIGFIIFSWIIRITLKRDFRFYAGELLLPTILFGGSLVVGLLYGMGTGGSPVIALWEARPIFYMPVMLIATSSLIEDRGQIKILMWLCIIAIFIEGLIGSYIVLIELRGNIRSVDRLAAHSSAIHMNTFFIFFAASWLYRVAYAKRLVLLFMIPPIALTYLASQRRASFVSLGIALVIFAFILFVENRRVFWMIAPVAGIIAVAYIGVFWNSTSSIALPAQAVKSIIAPDPNSVDESSNIYRVIENVNVSYTVHESPLFGVGFGKKFFVVIPMADISFFDWWEYIVHNSIFWFWLKTGVIGFISMLALISSGIMLGVRVIWRLPGEELNAIAVVCMLYVVMHFLYAYVDMSWDNQSMLYVGVCLGLLNCFEHVVAKPVPVKQKVWAWQTDQEAAPTLLPLPYDS